MSEPIFTKRHEKERYQVRFWSRPEEYAAFTAACEKHGIVYQDAFNDFMAWFCQASERGELTVQTKEPS